jgi:hypothetical protein
MTTERGRPQKLRVPVIDNLDRITGSIAENRQGDLQSCVLLHTHARLPEAHGASPSRRAGFSPIVIRAILAYRKSFPVSTERVEKTRGRNRTILEAPRCRAIDPSL